MSDKTPQLNQDGTTQEESDVLNPNPTRTNSDFSFKEDFLGNFILLIVLGGTGVTVFALNLLPEYHTSIFISLSILFISVLVSPFIDIKQI